MRVLITTKRGTGHFGPLIPFAHALVRDGAEVLVATPRSARAMVEAEGLEAVLFDEAPEERRNAAFAAAFALPEEERAPRVLAEVFARLDAAAALRGVLEACRSWGPDLVMSEISEFAGPLAAEERGVPAVRVSIGQLARGGTAIGPALGVVDELRARIGLPPDPQGERLAQDTLFTLMPAALEDPAIPRARQPVRFREADEVPAADEGVRWAGDERPLVHVTFGTVTPSMDLFPGLYRAAIDALSTLPVAVLVAVGRDRDPAALGPLPDNVRVERWVPQRGVMAHSAALVCHGGSGTVTTALAAGVPMAVLPIFADQPWNAERVDALGAGIALMGGPEAVGGLRDAVATLIADPAYREAAARVAEEIRALPSVDEAPRVLRALLAE
jgi:UDP:flavonoid glycosyltransferase YjiC (YdhE family)